MTNENDPIAKPSLTTKKLYPENQESPIHFLSNKPTPASLFYKRNHFSYPPFNYASFWLSINGSVKNPIAFSIEELLALPSKTVEVVLECAGNKRSSFKPKVFGEQWEKGAMSVGRFKGVPLKTLLDKANIDSGSQEVVIEGYDDGYRSDLDHVYAYMRSLPLKKALHPDTIIAYSYNGQPLPFKHGYPLRLIVPGWYAMASVKWVKQLTVISASFAGPFQTMDYMYYPNHDNDEDAFPVTTINVNSTIQSPLDRDILDTGKHTIKGIAWTGDGVIKKVEVSVDGGESWMPAAVEKGKEFGLFQWSLTYPFTAKKEYTIMSRATDSNKSTQPASAFWNRKGYGYNAVDQVTIKIE
ncbi:sulfite oxidase [Alkalihalophilus pseudofirmus]|uniref:Sulfite oxidase n=1 Tax=Alkalihalophilus pseudofirmus TaxID=79885 RepID=A0AAJ2KXU0_ALKPS|nr:sulfite oxidase [Alkalihalophilus pseudofirmus]MDV2883738.1 sulfite oxidase [Alkalihalophilus pseudofirmus]